MNGRIEVYCGVMPTFADPDVPGLRWTTELRAEVKAWLPDGTYLEGYVDFPVTAIRRKYWWMPWIYQVDQCTASGFLSETVGFKGSWPINITLKPETALGPLALPVLASGTIIRGDMTLYITGTFPFAWSTWKGDGEFDVAAVVGLGTIT